MEKLKPEDQEQTPSQEPIPPPPTEIAFSEADVSTRYEDVYEIVAPDEVETVRWRDGAYEFICRNKVALRIQVIMRGIVRLRYSPDGPFLPDFSYCHLLPGPCKTCFLNILEILVAPFCFHRGKFC